jgi:hypothetical protein
MLHSVPFHLLVCDAAILLLAGPCFPPPRIHHNISLHKSTAQCASATPQLLPGKLSGGRSQAGCKPPAASLQPFSGQHPTTNLPLRQPLGVTQQNGAHEPQVAAQAAAGVPSLCGHHSFASGAAASHSSTPSGSSTQQRYAAAQAWQSVRGFEAPGFQAEGCAALATSAGPGVPTTTRLHNAAVLSNPRQAAQGPYGSSMSTGDGAWQGIMTAGADELELDDNDEDWADADFESLEASAQAFQRSCAGSSAEIQTSQRQGIHGRGHAPPSTELQQAYGQAETRPQEALRLPGAMQPSRWSHPSPTWRHLHRSMVACTSSGGETRRPQQGHQAVGEHVAPQAATPAGGYPSTVSAGQEQWQNSRGVPVTVHHARQTQQPSCSPRLQVLALTAQPTQGGEFDRSFPWTPELHKMNLCHFKSHMFRGCQEQVLPSEA